MPIKLLFEFRTLKLFLKTYKIDEILSLKKSHNYNTRATGLKTLKANNKRGERTLLGNGIILFNRYQLGESVVAGCDLSHWLVGRLWGLSAEDGCMRASGSAS